jgi:hypothetical protein
MTLDNNNNWTSNGWADWWRDFVKVYVMPSNGRKPKYDYRPYLYGKAIELEFHEHWKRNNDFDTGITAICSLMDYIKPVYFIGIDLDNAAATKAFCAIWDKTLQELADTGEFLIDETSDKTKAHIYIHATKPFKFLDKSAYNNINIKDPNVPIIEIKRTITVAPTPHPNGSTRQLLNDEKSLSKFVNDLTHLDHVEKHIDSILSKHGIAYLFESDNGNGNGNGNGNKKPIDDDEIFYEGSRHVKLYPWACRQFRIYHNDKTLEEIKQIIYVKNKKDCRPPLLDHDVEQICKSAEQFIAGEIAKEQKQNQEKYPELQGNIYHRINNKPEKYIVADKLSNQLKEYEARHTTVKGTNPDIIKYYLIDTNTYLGCIPDKIIKHKNPLTFVRIPELYTISFIDISGDTFTLKQKTLPNIMASLKDRACVFKDGANNALNVIIQAFKKRQLVEISEDIPYTGFLPLEGNKILVSNVEIKQPSPDDVAQALSVIEQSEKFYKDRLGLIATGMVWVMIAPFNFIMKTDNYFLKLLSLYGVANSTKTNTALILLAVDGHHEEKGENIYILSYTSVDSNAKFGEAVSKTTFPILIDEIEDLTDEHRRGQNQFTDNIKTLAGKKILRKRTSYNRTGDMDEFPALSIPILVSNFAPPLRDSGYMRRTITRNHPKNEMVSPDDPITKLFETFLNENLFKLKALGDFRNWYVINHQEIILGENKPKPLNIGLELLRAAYSYAGREGEIPEWLVSERIPETQLVESIQESDVIIKSGLGKYINEQVIKAIPVWRQENPEFELPKTITKRFIKLVKFDLLPDVKFNKNSEILISKGILIELYRHGVSKDQLTDLKSLANYMNGEHRKSDGRMYVAITESKLNDYFNTVIDDQKKIDRFSGSDRQ